MAEDGRNITLDAAAPPTADPETENVLDEMWAGSIHEIRNIDPGKIYEVVTAKLRYLCLDLRNNRASW